MICIAAAMDAEIEETIRRITLSYVDRWGVSRIHIGDLGGVKVCCAKTGVGKVFASATTAHLITKYRPEAFIFIGTAGALDPSLEIGDIVIATDSVQHDLDATQFGFARGEVPYDGYRFFSSSAFLVEAATKYGSDELRVRTGRIVSGDQFCDLSLRRERRYLDGELGGVAIEMEGAAAAAAATLAKTPFLLARIVSDRADGVAKRDFSKFIVDASFKLASFVEYIVSVIAAKPTGLH